jgi:hypothetical protein
MFQVNSVDVELGKPKYKNKVLENINQTDFILTDHTHLDYRMCTEYIFQRIGITIAVSVHEQLITGMRYRVFLTQDRWLNGRPCGNHHSANGRPCLFDSRKSRTVSSVGLGLAPEYCSNFLSVILQESMQDKRINIIIT